MERDNNLIEFILESAELAQEPINSRDLNLEGFDTEVIDDYVELCIHAGYIEGEEYESGGFRIDRITDAGYNKLDDVRRGD